MLYLHVTLVPFIPAAGELKTKPTQHSVNELRRIGIHPDIVVCRSTEPLSDDIRDKIALFADVDLRRGDRAARRPRRLPRSRDAAGGGPRRARLREARPRRAGRRPRRVARAHRAKLASCGRRSRSRSSASTSSCTTRTSPCTRRSSTRGVHSGCRVRVRWVDAEHMSYEEAVARARAGGRRPRPRRLRLARLGGQDPRLPRRARARDPVPRHLPRHARRRVRVRAKRRAGWTAPTRPRWIRRRRIPVIDLLPEQKEIEDLGGTMRLGAQAVELATGRARARPTASR